MQGIGRRYAHIVCKKADVDVDKRAGELSEEEVSFSNVGYLNGKQLCILIYNTGTQGETIYF